MSGRFLKVAILIAVVLALALAAPALAVKGGNGKGQGGGHKPAVEAGNNLSFPAIAVGASIGAIDETKFEVPYLADGVELYLDGYDPTGPWYAQKVDNDDGANVWQADYVNSDDGVQVTVRGIDWGDLIESVPPTLGRPYRLETGLYVDVSAAPMEGRVMAVLANPSRPDEVQGTNKATYDSNYATIYSDDPGLRIQKITDPDATLEWNATDYVWTADGVPLPETTISFGPELNVAGKYIFGASEGGWKPTGEGTFRITFYIPATSDIAMVEGTTRLGNLDENGVWVDGGSAEGGGALPVVVPEKNLSYVDVTVVTKGGGGGNTR